MANFKAVIYTAGNTIFVPTTRTVKQPYVNGNYGDQLWEQILEGRMTGNLWTEKEIESLAPVMKNLDVIVRDKTPKKPVFEDGKGNEEIFPDDDPSFQYYLGW